MKNIALVVAACAALVASAPAQGVSAPKCDHLRTLGVLMGVDLSKPWPDRGNDTLKIPKPIGPFEKGYVYLNPKTEIVYQYNLRADCAPGATADSAINTVKDVEAELLKLFPGMEFRPRLGRPEYLYGRYADVPNGNGWGVALYVTPPENTSPIQVQMTFWNPSLDVRKD